MTVASGTASRAPSWPVRSSVSSRDGSLVAAAIPYFDIKVGFSGVSTLPDSFQSKQGFEILEREFAGGQVYPAEVVIDGDVNSCAGAGGDRAAARRIVAKRPGLRSVALRGEPGRRPRPALVPDGGRPQLRTRPTTPSSACAATTSRRPSAASTPRSSSTGLAADNLDFFDLTAHYTPIVFAFVLGLSFLLLMMVFRSIVVPAKAIIMNLLSVGAAYGLLVLVFQKGVGAELLGFQQVEAIEAWLPLFLFSVLFGLSMDYHVFLLSRIREHYDQTGDNTDAVAFGLRSTGRLITGAALIMVAVFGGFALGELVMFQQMGFGLGVAVLIDATIVRSVLVPAAMELLGDWNWYLPPVLSWLPHLRHRRPAPAQNQAAEPAGGRWRRVTFTR